MFVNLHGLKDANITLENTGNAKAAAAEFVNKGLEDVQIRNEALRELSRATQFDAAKQSIARGGIGLRGSAKGVYDLAASSADDQVAIERERREALKKADDAARKLGDELTEKSDAARAAVRDSGAPDRVKKAQIARIDEAEKEQLIKFSQEKEQINAEYDECARQHAATAGQQLIDLQHQQQEQFIDLKRSYATATLAVTNSTNEANLRAQGLTEAAELLSLKNANAAKIEEIKHARDEQLKNASPDERSGIISGAQSQIDAVRANETANVQLLRFNAGQELTVKLLTLQSAAGDAAAGIELKRLQLAKELREEKEKLTALGLDASGLSGVESFNAKKESDDAHLASLRAESEAGDALAGVELTRLERAKNTRDLEAQLLAIMKDQTATAQQRAQAETDLAKVRAAAGAAIDQTLRNQTEQDLSIESSTGKTKADRQRAKRQLETLKIQDELKSRLAAAQSILADPNASAAQKAEAAANLQQFGSTVQQQFDSATQDKTANLSAHFGLKERGLFLTGAGEAAAERNNPQLELVRQSKAGLDVQRQILAAIQQFLTGKTASPAKPVFAQ